MPWNPWSSLGSGGYGGSGCATFCSSFCPWFPQRSVLTFVQRSHALIMYGVLDVVVCSGLLLFGWRFHSRKGNTLSATYDESHPLSHDIGYIYFEV